MPIPKPMRWGANDFGFARPVHWLVVLLGGDIVDVELLGVKADRMSRGHRFMFDKPVWFTDPADYVESLRAAKVLVDPDERRGRIRAEVERAAQSVDGRARIEPGILEEVNGLVEWPKAVLCSFEREFLRVPQEALIATMEANQKFFPVLDSSDRLSEHFVGIANIESKDEGEVRKGYERVIRPRFADAGFFFDEDLKQGLSAMGAGLSSVTYQAKLGTVADKAARIAALAGSIAAEVGVDRALADRAARVSKNDLQSRMVGEFPELQGYRGRYYALHDEALADVGDVPRYELAQALDEIYMPRFAGDDIATSKLGQVLAIAERLDTLAGGFAAGLRPTGNKDPFALRRNALGLARNAARRRSRPDAARAHRARGRAAAGAGTGHRRLRRHPFRLRPPARLLRRPWRHSAAVRCRAQRGARIAAGLRRARRRDPCIRGIAGGRGARRRQQAHPQHPAQGRGRRRDPARCRVVCRGGRARARRGGRRRDRRHRSDARPSRLCRHARAARAAAPGRRHLLRQGDGQRR